MKTSEQRTYQTRLSLRAQDSQILSETSHLLSQVERSLIAEVNQGNRASSAKNTFLKKFQITARQFNACRVSIEGKIASYKACRELKIDALQAKKQKLEKQCKQLEKTQKHPFRLHQKKRSFYTISQRLEKLVQEKKYEKIALCFGSKRLFRSQFHLEKNGFTNHEEWKQVWQDKRNCEFFLLGSKDENMGNQSCVASLQENGKICLSLRLPPALEESYGKHLVIKDLHFSYGQREILASLEENLSRKVEKKKGSSKERGQAICYRFRKDKKGWQVFVTTSLSAAPIQSRSNQGVIGIDLNADHIACVETDRYGNPVETRVFSWNSYGRSKNQSKAITGNLCKTIVAWAETKKKALVIEDLDFKKKKMELSSSNEKQARMLSSFSYGLFRLFLQARAYRKGIRVHFINPAYTSVIGAVKFTKRYGLSTHLAAALCIGRRHQGFSEKPSCHEGSIPDGKGFHVTFSLPARNRKKHVWSFWAKVKKKIRTVLAAHFQAIRYRSLSPPLPTL